MSVPAEQIVQNLNAYVNDRLEELRERAAKHEALLAQGKKCGCKIDGCSICGYRHNCLHHEDRQIYADLLSIASGFMPGTFGRRS